MSSDSRLNAEVVSLHSLLSAILKDCREYYVSRSAYDEDHKVLMRLTLNDLYQHWKRLNIALATADFDPFNSNCMLKGLPKLTVASDARYVRHLRQLFGFLSRLECNTDPKPALEDYARRVSSVRTSIPQGLRSRVRELVGFWLGPCPSVSELIPRHGPGSTADAGRDPEKKVVFTEYYPQLDAIGGQPLLYLNGNHSAHEPWTLKTIKHPMTKVVSVPKDFSKPRIISCEPSLMQFLQQGVARYMMQRLEYMCPFIHFSDQLPNRMLARDLSQATLDLSNASDTVSRRLVASVLPRDWKKVLFALRSHFARMPDGRVIPLRAFAPMGSALCFPVESLIFAAVTVAILEASHGYRGPIANMRGRVLVYGDDIIVPVEYARDVMVGLRLCGFEPNASKCCFNGLFRESCGAEWYNGVDVSVVRPRSLSMRYVGQDTVFAPSGAMPMVLHANQLYRNGFVTVAKLISSNYNFPVALGDWIDHAHPDLPWKKVGRMRWNRRLQVLEQESLVARQVTRPSNMDSGYKMLFVHLTSGWTSDRVLIPRVKPKIRWVLAAPSAFR